MTHNRIQCLVRIGNFIGLYQIVLVLMMCGWTNPVFAKPTLTEILPRSVTIGQTTPVTLNGNFPQWPVRAWVDRPGLQVRFGEKGKANIVVEPDAIPGIFLVRVLDDNGASGIIPLVVDRLANQLEKEPNDSFKADANAVDVAANVSGVLGKSGDVDCFRIECTKGTTLYARVRANPLFSTVIDPVVQICDERGFVIDQNDDKRGIDPELAVEIKSDGVYFVRVFAFPATPNSSVNFAGGKDYRYLLTISHQPIFQMTDPIPGNTDGQSATAIGIQLNRSEIPQSSIVREHEVVNFVPGIAGFFECQAAVQQVIKENGLDAGQALEPGFDLTGRLAVPGEIDWFRLQCKKGTKLRIKTTARRYGLETDPELTVFDGNGKVLVTRDDRAKNDPDVSVDFSPPRDGVFHLRVRDSAGAGGPGYFYRLTVDPIRPDFELILKTAELDLTVGKPGELEVTVTRLDGFDQAIELTATGLPNGVTVEKTKSEAKGESAKNVKLKFTAKRKVQFACQIQGQAKTMNHAASQTIPSGQRTRTVWVTVK